MNAQITLEKTGIPSYFGAWRESKEYPRPPEAYVVHTQMRVEDAHADDGVEDYRVYAYVNLWSELNPSTAAKKIREAMYADGWSMAEELTEYVEDAKRFRVSWTWVGLEDSENAAGN